MGRFFELCVEAVYRMIELTENKTVAADILTKVSQVTQTLLSSIDTTVSVYNGVVWCRAGCEYALEDIFVVIRLRAVGCFKHLQRRSRLALYNQFAFFLFFCHDYI